MSERPFVSVIIPTYNRSVMLRQTVETFLAQSYPADRWELLLVDNNSTDNTWSVIQQLAIRDERIRPMRELRKGAHFARNSGALAANGTVLYFTDDDMLADPSLLASITRSLRCKSWCRVSDGKSSATLGYRTTSLGTEAFAECTSQPQ